MNIYNKTGDKESKQGYFYHYENSYFPVFSPNTGKYGPGKTPYLDTFHAVYILMDNSGLTRRIIVYSVVSVNPLSANPTKLSNTLKQFVGNSRRIV